MFNTGQMLLVLGAVVLFATLLPSLNETILYSDKNQYAARAEVAAVTLAHNILSQAATRLYDRACATGPIQNLLQLTPAAQLGADPGEVYPYFNDLDDFGDVNLVDTTSLPSIHFTITAQVDYVNPANPTQVSGSQTWMKRLRVFVNSPYLADPVTADSIQIRLDRLYTYF
jgi:hypothetical protein